jgi:hypothetical protein
MQRICHQVDAEVIAAAFAFLPTPLAGRLEGVHFLTGVDPLFAGLHVEEIAEDGRSYRDTAHVVYPFHLRRPAADRVTTVVIPTWDGPTWWWPAKVIHELGHVLDWQLGFIHHAALVTSYAKRNRREAFAEAFAAWALPFGHGYGDAKDQLYDTDRGMVALFDTLAVS